LSKYASKQGLVICGRLPISLLQVHSEGKYVVDINKSIDTAKLTPTVRVALKSDSYELYKILPNKVDPLVSLMKVEKVCKDFMLFWLIVLISFWQLGPRFHI